jgi:hypothetical protein
MTAILAIVTRLLGLVAELLGIATLIRGFAENSAQEHSPYLIEGIVTTAGLSIANPTYGLAAAHAEREAILAAIAALNAPVLAAIAALPAGSALVNPPSSGDNADAVWLATLPLSGGLIAGTAQQYAGYFALRAGEMGGWRTPDNPYFVYRGWLWDHTKPLPDHGWPTGDWLDISADDTRLTWLTRTEPSYAWTLDQYSGMVQAESYQGGTSRFTLTEPQFKAVRDQLAGATPNHPPTWPGVADVTLGITVPCAESTVLELPMDGLLILITSYPATRSRWGAPPYLSVYHTGRLAFVTDNGDVEEFQYMGWTNAIYTPRSMKRAAGVVIFLEPNVEAAATPWDITT